jgi:hypothetical protein
MTFYPTPLTTGLRNAKQTPFYALRTRKINTTITLVSSLNPSMRGDNVTFTATVADHLATGMVTFLDGSTPIGTGTLNSSGIATFSTSTLLWSNPFAPPHSMTAAYGGDKIYNPCTSAALTQVVNPPNLQMDSTSVGIINGYATFVGRAADWTGLLPLIGRATWVEGESDGSGIEISAFISSQFRIVLFFGPDAIEIDFDYAGSLTNWPIGTWTQTGIFPGGFIPTNPPGWPGPATINIDWA